MPIALDTPTTVPASEAKVYDTIYLQSLMVRSQPSGLTSINAVLRPARKLESGAYEFCPGKAFTVTVPDFFSVATEAEMATVMTLIERLKARIPTEEE